MQFCFDVDGTLCTNTWGEYEKAKPIHEMIAQVNALYDAGHDILLFTARGSTTDIDWRSLTEEQMRRWSVKYHALQFGKPQADFYIDDRGLSIEEWRTAMPEEARAAIAAAAPAAVEERAQVSAAKDADDSIVERADYLNVVYSKARRPDSDYPLQLARHLLERYAPAGGRLLDMGCGRGDMLRAFDACGVDVTGLDISPATAELCRPLTAYTANLSSGTLPVPSDSFDIVFSKSVVEHLHNPLPYLESMLAALKPGGVAMILTPSWLHHGWGPFYLDHTHVTPFTAPSLDDAVTIAGFEQVRVEHFRQLPFLWRWPALTLPVRLFAKLPLPYAPMHPGAWKWPTGFNKFIRFSKEVMLLASARKPTRAI